MVNILHLAMVLLFVLQHLLQVQGAGQVALGQMVAELRNTEQTLLHAHRFAADNGYTDKHEEHKSILEVLWAIFNCCREVMQDYNVHAITVE